MARRRTYPLAVALMGALAAAAACVGNDPDRTNSDDDKDRDDVGNATTDGGADAVTPGDPDAAGPFAAICGTASSTTCGASDPILLGQPSLHLDACSVGGPARAIATWSQPELGRPALQPFTAGEPGGVYCPNGLLGRPAVAFETHGFTLPSGDTTALDTANGNFTLVVVMRYGVASSAAAGGIVFQRNSSSAPHFPGPQLAAHFAFAATPGLTDLVSTEELGVSLQFGTNGGAPATRSISAVSDQRIVGAHVISGRRAGADLVLRSDGTVVSTDVVPAGFTGGEGTGFAVNIGRAASENNFFSGAIGELLYYSTDLNDTQLSAIERVLKAKWGTP